MYFCPPLTKNLSPALLEHSCVPTFSELPILWNNAFVPQAEQATGGDCHKVPFPSALQSDFASTDQQRVQTHGYCQN